jgi:short-subunit dehydrogenase
MIGNKDSYALVTGASSGIGYELARLFAKDGKNVVVVARSRDKLEELKKDLEKAHGTKVKVLAKDLSDPQSPQEIFAELGKEGIDVDVLVNNAGFAEYGKFADTDWQKEAEMLQVNIVSLTALTKLFLKKMVERRSGKILNVSSGLGLSPAPLFSVYGATKAYVANFSGTLADELRHSGVSVTCFFPWVTKTGFWERANAQNCKAKKMKLMDAATAAKVAYVALRRGNATAFANRQMSLMVFLSRFTPKSLVTAMQRSELEPV